MKNSIFLLSLILLSSIFISCKKHKSDFAHDFSQSASAWSEFKSSSGNNYTYEAAGSSWTGFSWKTVITVRNGKVIQRSYKLTPQQGNPGNIPANQLEWTETENEINTHTQSYAAEGITLDEVYEKASTIWLIKGEKRTIYFESKNNGMISLCGYREEACSDDCFTGIRINYIQPL